MLNAHQRRALRALLIQATRRSDADQPGVALPALQALCDEAPMPALPEAAGLHRLGGVVLRGLDGVDGLHPDVRARLGELDRLAGLKHLLYLGSLAEIGRAFDHEGLSWVVMKGPILAANYYSQTGDRMYGDLDLLVDRRHFPRAVRVLEDLGYWHDIHNWALAEAQMAAEITMRSELVSIDLHWQLHYSLDVRRSFDLRPEVMLGRSRHIALGPMQAPTFDPVDTLLSVCFHAARSDGHRLIWLKDIERVLVTDGTDFDELIRRARAMRVGPPVGAMLARAERILGAPVPRAVVESLVPSALRIVERQVSRRRDPIQFHEDPTLTRLLTRSIRSSAAASLTAVPVRSAQLVRRRWFPPPENETDDEQEKESFLQSVASSSV